MRKLGPALVVCALTVVPACSGDGTGGGGGDADGTGEGGDDGIPGNAYCDATNGWDSGYSAMEQEVLSLVNMHRSQGANCGSQGNFGPTSPLTMQSNLRCAARVHTKDMADRNYFDHTNPDGDGPQPRIEAAGYMGWTGWGENIAAGSPDAAGSVGQWMGSDGHCANIMNPDFTEIGVGYYPGGQYGHLWTQVFGRR